MDVTFHARLVRELADRRESYGIIRRALEGVSQRGTPFRELVANAVGSLAERIRPPADDAPLSRTLMDAIDDIDAIWQGGATITGLPSGLSELDEMTHGFQPGHLVIVAGRPASGKTQLALRLTHQACTRADPSAADRAQPWPVLFDSLEMTRRELVKRLLRAEAGYDWWTDIAREVGAGPYMKAAGALSNWPLEIEEQAYTVPQLRLRTELFRRRYSDGPIVIVVDYLSHLRLDYSQGDRRDAMIGEQITRPLKRLARDMDATVILLCQLNRASARPSRAKPSDDKPQGPLPRPTLTDLKDSGDIEQDADQVVFIHPLGPNGAHRQDGKIEVGLEKNRHGRAGWLDARFDASLGKYSEWPRWDHPRYSSPAPEDAPR
jgi:replicative DNA helicase